MDNAAHTPGPWEWRGDQLYSVSAQLTLLRDVAFWNYKPGDKPLIAAAPDMLAVLKSLVADILEYERINNLVPNPGKRDCWQSVTNARAIIAKAQGATP